MSDINANTIQVRNLSFKTTEEDLQKVYIKFGKITSISIIKTTDGLSKGCGLIEFASRDAASNAAKASLEINGRVINTKIIYKQIEPKIIPKSQSVSQIKENPGPLSGPAIYSPSNSPPPRPRSPIPPRGRSPPSRYPDDRGRSPSPRPRRDYDDRRDRDRDREREQREREQREREREQREREREQREREQREREQRDRERDRKWRDYDDRDRDRDRDWYRQREREDDRDRDRRHR